MEYIPFIAIAVFLVLMAALKFRAADSRTVSSPPPDLSAGPQPEEPQAGSPPAEPPEPDTGGMVLQTLGRGERRDSRLSSRATQRMQWVSRETDPEGQPLRSRTPEEHTSTHLPPLPFTAAGKLYASLGGLTAQKLTDGTYLDCHGRRVISLAERFPCFDSYDYATENRYYRWYIIIEPERLTRVYTEDDIPQIYITEDVRDLEDNCVNALKTLGLVI